MSELNEKGMEKGILIEYSTFSWKLFKFLLNYLKNKHSNDTKTTKYKPDASQIQNTNDIDLWDRKYLTSCECVNGEWSGTCISVRTYSSWGVCFGCDDVFWVLAVWLCVCFMFLKQLKWSAHRKIAKENWKASLTPNFWRKSSDQRLIQSIVATPHFPFGYQAI